MTATTTGLDALVRELDTAVHGAAPGGATVEAVCTTLQPFLGRPDLLSEDQRQGDPTTYRAQLLHAAEDGAWSLIGLVWLPGQVTPIHDHLCWCVVGVHEGGEFETRYALSDDGTYLIETASAHAGVGDVSGLMPPGDIHRVRNDSDQMAISLHVYGADVRGTNSSTRRRYDLPVTRTAG